MKDLYISAKKNILMHSKNLKTPRTFEGLSPHFVHFLLVFEN